MKDFLSRAWADDIVPALRRYIEIPNRSPAFDPDWHRARPHGPGGRAGRRVVPRAARCPGCSSRSCGSTGARRCCSSRCPARSTQRCCSTATSTSSRRWTGGATGSGRGRRCCATGGCTAAAAPTTATPRSRRVTAIEALRAAGHSARALRGPHRGLRGERQRRPAGLRRGAGASASARPSLVVCLDSGCGNYERLWVTTSLRGLVARHLRVATLDRGRALRCGAGGIVPSSFRIAAPAAQPARGRAHGRDPAAVATRRDSRRAPAPGGGRGGGPRGERVRRRSRSRRARGR